MIEIVHTVETKVFICPICGRKDAEIYHRNTAYHDYWRNVAVACEYCQREEYEYYADLWADYYGGLL